MNGSISTDVAWYTDNCEGESSSTSVLNDHNVVITDLHGIDLVHVAREHLKYEYT